MKQAPKELAPWESAPPDPGTRTAPAARHLQTRPRQAEGGRLAPARVLRV